MNNYQSTKPLTRQKRRKLKKQCKQKERQEKQRKRTIKKILIEKSPPSHILTQPIPENIQKHMLEHADGKGEPGIIIQYNCKDFDCKPDLIQKLTALVEEYPDNVYLAPNNYGGKIILTKLGKREILDGFDEQEIKNFIE